MIIKCEAEAIRITPEISLEIDSYFDEQQLLLIENEIGIIKKEKFLHEQVRVGGEILGDIFGKEDYTKVLLLSEYVDQIVSKLQCKHIM